MLCYILIPVFGSLFFCTREGGGSKPILHAVIIQVIGNAQGDVIELLCEAEGIEIMKGVVSSDHIHMNVEYAPKTNVSYMIKQ